MPQLPLTLRVADYSKRCHPELVEGSLAVSET